MADFSNPATNAMVVTTSDTVDLAAPSRGLLVTADGDLTVVMLGGQTITFSGLVAGSLLPIRVKRVKATGTTATVISLW